MRRRAASALKARGRGSARAVRGARSQPLGQTPAAFGLALEQGDQGEVGRQAPGQGEQGRGRAVLQLQLQFAQGLDAVACRQLALVIGGLDHGALEGDQTDAAAHRAGEARGESAAAAFQQGGRRRRLQRRPVRGLAGDRHVPFGAVEDVAARLALQRLDEAALGRAHPQAPARAPQGLVRRVEIDGAQGVHALLARQGRMGVQARGGAGAEPKFEFNFLRHAGHVAIVRLSSCRSK